MPFAPLASRPGAKPSVGPAKGIDWPFRFSEDGSQIEFIRVDRDTIADSTFLDHRMLMTDAMLASVPVNAFTNIASRASHVPAAYLFHTSFCGSTLLASMLDQPGAVLSLKEPHLLAQVARMKRQAGVPGRIAIAHPELKLRLGISASLLETQRPPGESVLIKPTNVANNLIIDLLARGGSALFLYSSLAEFLRSMIKRGEEGRIYLRWLSQMLTRDGECPFGADPRAASALSDLQVGALAWARQIAQFRHFLEALEPGRAASLNYLDLLADPARVVCAAARFLWPDNAGAVPDVGAIEAQMSRDAKSGTDRAELERAERLDADAETILEGVLDWARASGMTLDTTLPHDIAGRQR